MISIVVPLFNEQDSLEELIRQIQQAVQTNNLGSYEVLLIDDGSNDLSWSVIEKISQKHSMVHGIRFRRNFGKAAALAAGFSAAKGELVVTMDADLCPAGDIEWSERQIRERQHRGQLRARSDRTKGNPVIELKWP